MFEFQLDILCTHTHEHRWGSGTGPGREKCWPTHLLIVIYFLMTEYLLVAFKIPASNSRPSKS